MKEKQWKPKVEYRDPSTLIPYVKNAKIHTKEQINKVAGAISAFGFTQPIVVDKDGVIIAGHCRREASISLGLKEVPVVIAGHLDEHQVMAARIADNKVSEAPWDADMLKFDLGTLQLKDFKMDLTGFSMPEIDSFMKDGELKNTGDSSSRAETAEVTKIEPYEAKSAEDEIPAISESRVKLGDVWQLGNHRLMCGDSTNKESVEALFGANIAEICFTSPPYSDQREYNGGKDLNTETLSKFISIAEKSCKFFIINLGYSRKNWEVNQYWDDYIKESKSCGLKLLSWNIWDKGECGAVGNHIAMFGISHEWIFVFGKEKKELNRTIPNKHANENSTHNWDRRKDGSIVKQQDRVISEYSQLKTIYFCTPHKERDGINHPARFPVRLPEGYIEAMTNKSDFVYEPFAGSGSTLIACEKTQRKCLAMEIDAQYCDIILSRWESFSGQIATKL